MTTDDTDDTDRIAMKDGRSRWWQLAGSLAAISLVWLAILPQVAHWAPVQRWIQSLEARHIDPSVMFYTEVEVLRQTRQHLDRLRREQPAAFGMPVTADPPSVPKAQAAH